MAVPGVGGRTSRMDAGKAGGSFGTDRITELERVRRKRPWPKQGLAFGFDGGDSAGNSAGRSKRRSRLDEFHAGGADAEARGRTVRAPKSKDISWHAAGAGVAGHGATHASGRHSQGVRGGQERAQYGLPESGRADAALFSVTYTEQVLNGGRCVPGEEQQEKCGPNGGAGGYAERVR